MQYSFTLAAATCLLAAHQATALALSALTAEGCFTSSTGLTFNNTYTFQTSGYCQPFCVGMGSAVLGLTKGSDCWCGDLLPPTSSKVANVDNATCNSPCDGFGTDYCGGDSAWTVYLTGVKSSVANADSTTTGSTSSTKSSTPSTVTNSGGQVVTVTAVGSSSASSSSGSSSGPSKAGIAAGVVVGAAAIFGVAGGAYFCLRSRRRREIEEEHRRTAAVNSFIGTGKPSTSSSSFSDTRLDPTMAQRRMSDGSIADNQDYSRRILKVTNA